MHLKGVRVNINVGVKGNTAEFKAGYNYILFLIKSLRIEPCLVKLKSIIFKVYQARTDKLFFVGQIMHNFKIGYDFSQFFL